MATKFSVETHGKQDAYGFVPSDLVSNFAKFTGRATRSEESIDKMVESLLIDGQEQPFTFRKGFGDVPIPITGHTRILAADRINQQGLGGYSNENPFIVKGLMKSVNEEEAILHTFRENDDETRTPTNALDKAFLIRVLSENYGYSDSQIADKLRKAPAWVAQHRALLELDSATQSKVAGGDISVNTAVTLANVAPEDREKVLSLASASSGGKKPTERSVANAARTSGARTSKSIKRVEKDFTDWVKANTDIYAAGPKQAFMFGILDYRSGKIDEVELTKLYNALH